ncbi:MAG TPA: hypothetical protein V6D06_06105 [Trichocoleus sp.]
MSTSSIQRALIPAACVAGTVFAVSTAPLAMYRSEVVQVEIKNQPLFAAEVRDLAGPYLGVVGVVSASVGACIMGFSGWRQAARKSEAAESKLSELQRNLLAQQTSLEAIKFSDARLRAQQLDAFLEAPAAPESGVAHSRAPIAAIPSHSVPPAAKTQEASNSGSGLVLPANYQAHYGVPAQPQEPVAVEAMKDRAMMALSAAQSYASYVRSSDSPELAAVEVGKTQGVQLDQLLLQLRELASQVEELRTGTTGSMAA